MIATSVGGIPEVVTEPRAGILMERGDAATVASAARRLLESDPDRADTCAYAARFGWEATTRSQIEIFGALQAPAGGAPE